MRGELDTNLIIFELSIISKIIKEHWVYFSIALWIISYIFQTISNIRILHVRVLLATTRPIRNSKDRQTYELEKYTFGNFFFFTLMLCKVVNESDQVVTSAHPVCCRIEIRIFRQTSILCLLLWKKMNSDHFPYFVLPQIKHKTDNTI